jgi:hypothetical protein
MLQLSPPAAKATVEVKNGKAEANITAQEATANFRPASIKPPKRFEIFWRIQETGASVEGL